MSSYFKSASSAAPSKGLAIASADKPNVIRQKFLLIELRENVLYIRFNRPEVKNALNRLAFYQLIRTLDQARNDDRVKLVVLSGVGDIFSAGNDLKQIQQYPNTEAFLQPANYILRATIIQLLLFPKVIVVLVNGPAIGIGMTLSALCDVIYCTDNAYFHAPFSQLGICAEACSSHSLRLLLGQSVAAETLLFGERLSAERALQLGFVSRIFTKEEIETTFWPKMMAYSKLPMDSLMATKRLMRFQQHDALITALYAECKALESLRKTDTYLSSLENFRNRNKSKL